MLDVSPVDGAIDAHWRLLEGSLVQTPANLPQLHRGLLGLEVRVYWLRRLIESVHVLTPFNARVYLFHQLLYRIVLILFHK